MKVKQLVKSILLLTTVYFCCINSTFADDNKPSFKFVDTKQQVHTLSQYLGKWVVVNYWATWCPPCLEEIPDLVALYDASKNKNLMIIGVAFDYESSKSVTDFAEDMLVSYPIVLGDKNVETQLGDADVLPTTYIFNPSGALVKIKRGIVTRRYLETLMQNNHK